jgi:hypothetical protein
MLLGFASIWNLFILCDATTRNETRLLVRVQKEYTDLVEIRSAFYIADTIRLGLLPKQGVLQMFQEWSLNFDVSVSNNKALDDIYEATQGYAGIIGLIGVKFSSLPSPLLTQGLTEALWQKVHQDLVTNLTRENTSQFYRLREWLLKKPDVYPLLDRLVSSPDENLTVPYDGMVPEVIC